MATDGGWVRSSKCSQSSCVEVTYRAGRIKVKEGDAHVLGMPDPWLSFNEDEWAAFVEGVKAGEFDVDTLKERQ